MARALRKNRDERFGSALKMARALAAVAPGLAGREGAGARSVPPVAIPLSRLPDIPSIFEPSTGFARLDAPVLSAGPTSPAPTESAVSRVRASSAPSGSSGGTLASAVPAHHVSEPTPQVVVVAPAPIAGTLPSNDLPIVGRARGVPRRLVAILVAAALLVGFALGWVVATRAA